MSVVKAEIPAEIAGVRAHIVAAKDALAKLAPSRENSLTKSKLDEAELWLMSPLVA